MAYKEIVTKAIIGKGKKRYQNTYQIETEDIPSTILGCWIINHNFQGKEVNNEVEINGSFDVNIWYSYDNDTKTKVITKKIDYREVEKMNRYNNDNGDRDIIIRSLKQPAAISAKEDGKVISVEIEKELGVEIIGDTKVKVSSVDEEDNWDILGEDSNSELDKINPDYIEDNLENK